MAYQSVTKSTIHQTAQNNITEVLNKINDPTASEKRKFVYQRYPKTASQEFDGWPIIVLDDYSPTDTSGRTLNGPVHNFDITVGLNIDTEDESGDVKKHHDQLSDRVVEKFLSGERYNLGDYRFSIPNGDYGVTQNNRTTGVSPEGKPLIRREMEIMLFLQINMDG